MQQLFMPENISVLVDGVFDCTHFAHANCLRRARQFGNVVVAGVHPDADVFHHKKCNPVFSQDERYELVRNLRYCDRIIEGMRYDYTVDDLDKNELDFNAHGDENVISGSGVALYQDIKDAGRYKVFPRTGGTCTTDVIATILDADLMNGTNHSISLSDDIIFTNFVDLLQAHNQYSSSINNDYLNGHLDTPDLSDRNVVYTQGNFNIFNVGNLKFLQAVKTLGDYLIVGLNTDANIHNQCNSFHLMNIIQRALNVLSYRCVDAVILRSDTGIIDRDFIDRFNISMTCHGDPKGSITTDWYSYPKSKGIFKLVDSGSRVTTVSIIQRVLDRRDDYGKRNDRKRNQQSLQLSNL